MKHIDQMHRIDPDNIQADSILGINEGVMFLGNAFWTDWLLLLFAIYIGFMLFKWEHENKALNLVSSCVRIFESVFYKSLIRACSFGNSLAASQNARSNGQTSNHRHCDCLSLQKLKNDNTQHTHPLKFSNLVIVHTVVFQYMIKNK